MMRNLRKLLPLVLLLAVILASCNTYTLSSKMQETNSPELDMDVLYTAAAETVAADFATLQAPTPSPTPIPTIGNSSFLDFDHLRLHEIAGSNPLKIVELVRDDYRGASYVAVIVDTGELIGKHEMLLFQMEDDESTLIYDLGPEYYLSLNLGNENHPDWLIKDIPGHIILIPVRISKGGSCLECSSMKVIHVSENGNAKDVTPDTDFVPKGFVYTTASDRAERIDIVAVQYYEFDYGAKCKVCSPYAFRLFSWDWDEDAYVDVSEEEIEFYDEKIMDLEKTIQKSYDKPFDSRVMPLLAQVFFNYESSGRVEYGWE